MDNKCPAATLDGEEEAVVADSTAEDTMPFFALQSFHISWKGSDAIWATTRDTHF